jgi:hypothetical protein
MNANWGSIPDWIAALVGAVAAISTLLVLREAKRIRENEMFHALVELWSQYNSDMINTGFAKKYGDLYEMNFDETKLNGLERQAIWSLINALQFTWTLAEAKLLPEFYLRHQAASWFYGLKPKRGFFLDFMDRNYVDPPFRNLVATLTSAADIDEAKVLFKVAYTDRKQRQYF